ncbi:MAG: 3-deoxy-manno-octulosonate cytidylyltransferase [Elusimicrobia bacterium]|nr:3-deoxy-manno-octulosonate cytidylyltransferase [Elusimicrobiota bacterium]
MSVLGVIPARYASTRFPGKPLAMIHGKPMIAWVYERARRALPQVVVATDDQRIKTAVENFGGRAIMTPRSLQSGTERMAYVARKMKVSYYVNVQGDEPLIRAGTIRAAVALSMKRKAIATPVTDLAFQDFNNENVVKVAVGHHGRALYFSRAPIPYPRNQMAGITPLKHVGLYVYPRKDLLRFVSLPSTPLEKTEMLEQLRALYYGIPIFVVKTKFDSMGVDTPADLRKVLKNWIKLNKEQ